MYNMFLGFLKMNMDVNGYTFLGQMYIHSL